MTTANSQIRYAWRQRMANGPMVCIVALAATTVTLSSQAQVYKSVSADGRVLYTDNPNTAYRASQSTHQVTVLDTVLDTLAASASTSAASANQPSVIAAPDAPTISAKANPITTPPVTIDQSTDTSKLSQRGDYQLAIATPNQDATYRRGVAIGIQLQLSPSLKAGDRLVYSLDNQHLATTRQTTFSIPTLGLNPGSHTISVQLENGKGEGIRSVSQSVIILPNNGVLRRQRQAAVAAKAAYDQLPWYKKIKVNISL